MDTETSKTIEILRSSLVDCLNCLKIEQEKLNILSDAVRYLLDTQNKEPQHSMTAFDLKDLGALENAKLDAVLEKLKAIPKTN